MITERILGEEGTYRITVEIVDNIFMLEEMVRSIEPYISNPAGQHSVVDEFMAVAPNLIGFEFTVLTYYNRFVSPSNLVGYALVGCNSIPQIITDELREMLHEAQDEEVGKLFFIASRNDPEKKIEKQLLTESNKIIHARARMLRSL